MSKVRDGTGEPRAVIHKRILDVANDRPDASMTDIAAEVSGATPDLVERVLSEYGDPGGDTADTEQTMSQNGQSAHDERNASNEQPTVESDGDSPPELTDTQLQTVSAVYEQPEASQGEIAERLGVSRATVSRRLNDIPGFEWTNRQTFTSNLFDSTGLTPETVVDESGSAESTTGVDDSPTTEADDSSTAEPDGSSTNQSQQEGIERVEERLDDIEGRLDAVASGSAGSDERGEPPLRPELAQKVVHAAMDTDRISEEEELELLEALLNW